MQTTTRTNGCNVLTPLHMYILGHDMPFRPCCDEHDLFYEQGGLASDRRFADKIFRQCIKESGYPISAWICWIAVRCMGWTCWNKESK